MQLPDPEELFEVLAKKIHVAKIPDIALVGIHTGGVWLAQRLHQKLGIEHPLGMLDVSFYRDDFDKRGLRAHVKPSAIPFDVEKVNILLVDDVLYTGRTIRAAINELFDYGRPGCIHLAALIDRGGRQLPIAPQYVGTELKIPDEKMLELRQDADGKLSLKLYDKNFDE
ncbi:MAG TPA: bifunctional pyr operon transcriptional regulator/uracil phosphoribosyltransferase PyrR [Nitrosomonas sp.]|nr:bifunctional pyr operon transcriptional regulator/uracil phosphoribosyltransferase PyrR [Nitrosomonas sp.]HQX14374.1 bifunctional pyr operon transcriptional regulator/uracil phosphoribosyltransferase PyrR [Nitrosomonas sp.]HRB33649.1 bifunctional pyr operon transcriptional regulator/uracil phosphoribosyltransferase PyrR [Nitrosomonas sp.]HRB46438.1 bifunctional pyr operon transcriptional regulator/uracil phosphoribosyltransferase PyrR [Nitrosomonas sp.]HRB78250.1 bifunctional pyr operon tran